MKRMSIQSLIPALVLGFAMTVGGLAVLSVLQAVAVETPGRAPLLFDAPPRPGQLLHDLPARRPAGFGRSDTLDFGYFEILEGQPYAVLGEVWTWDHGSSDPFEGWKVIDETYDAGEYFRQITAASWAGHGNQVAAPILHGEGSVWIGLFEDQADSLCWADGLGYGNSWCQHLISPEFIWGGGGDVQLSFVYFSNSELDYDYSRVLLQVGAESERLNGDGFTDIIGSPPSGPWASYLRSITPAEFGVPGPGPFRIVFEFFSDGGWSDEDGLYTTDYGPFGFDDLQLAGDVQGGPFLFDFEDDLQGWAAGRCPGVGSFFSIHPLSRYTILDPCQCRLSGNIAAFHDDNYLHPYEQWESIWSPPADRTGLQWYNGILAEWDQYCESGEWREVFYRPGWSYYPYVCPNTGVTRWSDRVGQLLWYYQPVEPVCAAQRNVGTDWGVPEDCQLVSFVYEVYCTCEHVPWNPCEGHTGFTPLIDNLRIRMTRVPHAPVIQFDPGCQFQDGFGRGGAGGFWDLGNADVGHSIDPWPFPDGIVRLGDSLSIAGPAPTPGTRWEAKLWLRIQREGPAQIHVAGFRAWKQKVRDGRQIVGPTGVFTWGWMDSVEVGSLVKNNHFASYFREDDDDYTPGTPPRPDCNEGNEIIPDGIFTPGTKIEYFITANYTCAPIEYFTYPDTSGGCFWEFEILPSYRTNFANGYPYCPSILYVDVSDRGVQPWMEGALNIILNGHAVEGAIRDIPDPTKWDRYDYLNAGSNYSSPLVRGLSPSNNGATIGQLKAYRLIVTDSGDLMTGMHVSDWQGLEDWLTLYSCGVHPWSLWAGGDNIAGIIEAAYPSFPGDHLGATLLCGEYSAPDCPAGDPDNDENRCVGLETVGNVWTPETELDLWGNGCPEARRYDVLGAVGQGAGQKSYAKLTPSYTRTDFAQVTQEILDGSTALRRSVIDGYGITQLITPQGGDPQTECAFDTVRALQAMTAEMTPMLRWLLGLDPGYDLSQYGLWVEPCFDPLGVPQETTGGGPPVDRLEPVRPNPLVSRVTLSYSLSRSGPASLAIFDVNGRRVRILLDGPAAVGRHITVWDGSDDAGHRVPAGVYWARLVRGGFASTSRMVVVR